MSPATDSHGYKHVRLSRGNKDVKLYKIQKLVAEAFLGHDGSLYDRRNPDSKVVHHKNFMPDDNRVENLEIVTLAELRTMRKKRK